MLHHPSLVACEPVIAAGEMVISEGVLCEISNASGHYRPVPSCLVVTVSMLRARGARLHPRRVPRPLVQMHARTAVSVRSES